MERGLEAGIEPAAELTSLTLLATFELTSLNYIPFLIILALLIVQMNAPLLNFN